MFLLRFLLRIAANGGALWLADRLLEGFRIIPHPIALFSSAGIPVEFHTYLAGGILLALLFTVVRPILKVLAFPLILITFGLFNIVISITLLAIADWLSAGLSIEGAFAFLLGSLIIAAANTLVTSLVTPREP